MAMSKSIETQFDLFAKDAYIKVSSATIENKENASFIVCYFANSNSKVPFNQKSFFIPHDMERPLIPQCYEHMKTLPEFSGATDC